MTLKVRILICLRRLFIILVSQTMTWFSEKMLISTRCIHGFTWSKNLVSLTWGRGLSKIAKNVDVLYERPLCELCCWANIANLSTEVAAGFENAPKTWSSYGSLKLLTLFALFKECSLTYVVSKVVICFIVCIKMYLYDWILINILHFYFFR